MRTIVIVFSAIVLMTLNSCKQETNVQALLENAETRSEILNTITGNHNFMTEFMSTMQANEHAMQMMQGNKKMTGMMMKGEGMQMMMKDSVMNTIMKDGKMMGNMMKMMHKKGMMSEDCMQSCMKMMSDKGMDMGGMNDDNKDNDTHNH